MTESLFLVVMVVSLVEGCCFPYVFKLFQYAISSLNALFVAQSPLWDKIKAEAVGHPYMEKISKLANESAGVPYTWRNGFCCPRVYSVRF